MAAAQDNLLCRSFSWAAEVGARLMGSMPVICYGSRVRDSTDFLQRIDEDQELPELLADAFEFDVRRKGGGESPRLASGIPLEGIAGDFTGGMFYLCGIAGSPRSVLYASSEGDAGIIATDLRETLMLVVGFPYWRDSLKYSAGGDLSAMKSATAFLCRDMMADRPAIEAEQSRVAEALCVPLETPSVLVARLHAAVKRAGPDFDFIDDTGEYGSLFGAFPPSHNRSWQ
ncbi:hypothetical protein M2271_008448 [Streptomyces sp. LBL]|uniref:hypothetical protein n=1 Tax=Streptomyces sp. LBL TaxID=2940562 RepID=UPI0024731930|nr:hypothetical protein [Streptomyces sp. LBL]MDH6630587.1 hypothetical protein [Streptomyces sp. LBL]